MKKTIDDYMNDPEIVNETLTLREVHAIRLKIYDEIKDMSAAEMTAYFHEGAARFFAPEKQKAATTP